MARTLRQFGSSNNPAYLRKQAAKIDAFVDENAYRLTRNQVVGYYDTVGQLRHRAWALEDPAAAAEAEAERKSHEANDW